MKNIFGSRSALFSFLVLTFLLFNLFFVILYDRENTSTYVAIATVVAGWVAAVVGVRSFPFFPNLLLPVSMVLYLATGAYGVAAGVSLMREENQQAYAFLTSLIVVGILNKVTAGVSGFLTARFLSKIKNMAKSFEGAKDILLNQFPLEAEPDLTKQLTWTPDDEHSV